MFLFIALPLKRVDWKTKTFLKKPGYNFLVERITIENVIFPYKLPYQNPMLRQIEWKVQNLPITKNEVLSLTT